MMVSEYSPRRAIAILLLMYVFHYLAVSAMREAFSHSRNLFNNDSDRYRILTIVSKQCGESSQ